MRTIQNTIGNIEQNTEVDNNELQEYFSIVGLSSQKLNKELSAYRKSKTKKIISDLNT